MWRGSYELDAKHCGGMAQSRAAAAAAENIQLAWMQQETTFSENNASFDWLTQKW